MWFAINFLYEKEEKFKRSVGNRNTQRANRKAGLVGSVTA
jgi:hypothetical protein